MMTVSAFDAFSSASMVAILSSFPRILPYLLEILSYSRPTSSLVFPLLSFLSCLSSLVFPLLSFLSCLLLSPFSCLPCPVFSCLPSAYIPLLPSLSYLLLSPLSFQAFLWWITPQRLVFYFLLRIVRRCFVPFMRLFLVIVIKKTLIGEPSDGHRLRCYGP